MTVARTVADVLTQHVTFEVECIDRMFLNVYQPELQYSAGLVGYVHRQLKMPIASTAPLAKISDRFNRAVHRFAESEGIPWVDFVKGQRKDDVMLEHLKRFTPVEGVVFIGRSQEKNAVFRTEKRRHPDGVSYPWIVKSTGIINQFYFYCVESDFGPFFLKFSSYFPYNAKLCINGHHWAQRQAAMAGIGFTSMDNAFAAVDDPTALQEICDRLGAVQIQALLNKWLAILPNPFNDTDREAGYRYQLSILQAEFSLTQMLDNPVSGRMFFEQVIRDNLDIGRPDQVSLVFDRRLMRTGPRATPGRFRTRVITEGVTPSLHVGLQTHHDQAVSQGRTGTSNRDHHQRHQRFRDQERSGESARTAGDRPARQPSPAGRPTTRPRPDHRNPRSAQRHRPDHHPDRHPRARAAPGSTTQPRPALRCVDLPTPTRRVHQP